ncbi:MAG TPA: L-serine ammonia-lyase, iron-sulfur-dependent, subunit alpha [Holophaga sp.]|nr:L-serine ammonia-lyase, iron-sulfur-dependent, subunit alpha [Holophaga sp.]HPS67371.1 L-serine ammonia-lyase, iron-sulfur-dependent, subunit alpha [Holophaga sp.]
MDKLSLLDVLRSETAPSLGVTEPGAVALACAAASDNNGIDTRQVELIVSPNIFKNCMAVGIPGINIKGIKAAAALGAVGGDHRKGLEALAGADSGSLEACGRLLADGAVSVEISGNGELLYIEAICTGAKGGGRCIIQGGHTRMVYLERDGVVLVDGRPEATEKEVRPHPLAGVTVADILAWLETASVEELDFLREAADMNLQAARWGLANRPGMGAGASLQAWVERGRVPDSLSMDLQAHTAAASDARVSGSQVRVMTCTGSGNHGITAIVPVARAAERLGIPDERRLRALALSVAITIYIKHHSGRLSGMCGCGVASATGVACALTYLQGGSPRQVEDSIQNMAGGITGMICDGAKEGCSLKLAAAVAAAVTASMLALDGVVVPGDNGILADRCERTMANMGEVSARGMAPTDAVILAIMQEE